MYTLQNVDFSKLIKRNLNEKHTLLIEYLDLNGKKQKKHLRNNGKDIYLEGIKELIKARVGYNKAWKDVLNKIKEMLIKKPELDFDEVEEIDMYSIKSLNNETLTNIYKNIENFANLWKKYKNILFVCGDYPGYGGAATNCDRMQKFFKERGHNTFAFYYNNNKSPTEPIKGNDIWIQDKSEIINITFLPDLIITKSFVSATNLKEIFKVPIIYCVGGIFSNSLDKYFYDLNNEQFKKTYSKNVIQQIKNSDFVFVNSSHTRDILKEKLNIHTFIFYSSFIQYFTEKKSPFKDTLFDERKYDYGVIMSNFNRSIKNAKESIQFLKDKKNVILIGENSSQFKQYGFTCIELISNTELNKYYREIKYIIQDSFSESCSNVRIEGIFYGCHVYSSSDFKYLFNTLIISSQYPFYGGAATLAYTYHNYLINKNEKTFCYFLLNDKETTLIKNNKKLINPNNYKNIVYNNLLLLNKLINLAENIYIINYGIIHFLEKNVLTDNKDKITYLVTGSPEFTLGDNSPVNKNISYSKLLKINQNYHNFERNPLNQLSLMQSKQVIFTDDHCKKLYEIIYPEFKEKYYVQNIEYKIFNKKYNLPSELKFINSHKRKYYFIAVASHWDRKVKNIKMIYNLFNKFKSKTHLIIGNLNNVKYDFNNIKNTHQIKFLENNEIHKLLKKSEFLLIPSFFESASITLLEGVINGCKIITSQNVAYSKLLPQDTICNDVYDIKEWIDKINNYPDNITLNLI